MSKINRRFLGRDSKLIYGCVGVFLVLALCGAPGGGASSRRRERKVVEPPAQRPAPARGREQHGVSELVRWSRSFDVTRAGLTAALALMQQCPSLSIEGCPGGNWPEGRSVPLRGEPGNASSYTWKLTVDGIDRTSERLSNQGQSNVTINTSGERGRYIASVDLGGLPQNCPTSPTPCEFRVVSGPAACPTIDVSCPETVEEGQPLTFTASPGVGDPNVTPTFNWTVSAGNIVAGQGTSTITVSTNGLGGQTITATVDVGGFDRSCDTSDSCTTTVIARPRAQKADEYGSIRWNGERAKLDDFAAQLLQLPTARGYVIVYGVCSGDGRIRVERARRHLVGGRGITADRILTVDGGCALAVKYALWILPPGAPLPTPESADTVSPCPPCRATARPRRSRTRVVPPRNYKRRLL